MALSYKSLEEIISQVCFCEGIKTSPELKESGARKSETCAFNVVDINGSSEIEIDDSMQSSILLEVFSLPHPALQKVIANLRQHSILKLQPRDNPVWG